VSKEAGGLSDTGWQPLRRLPRARATDATSQAFARLAVTHGVVMAGDTMVTVALAGSLFFSISPTAAQGKVALSLLFTMLPFGVVAPFLGPAIDRSKGGRRAMLIGAAAGRVVAALLMARWIHSLLLFPAALAMLILSKTHAVVKASLVPSVVSSTEGLVEANGKLAMLGAVVGFAAAAPASGVLKLFGGAWVLRLAAVVYVVGSVAALRLRPVGQPAAVIEETPPTVEEAQVLSRGVTLAATSMAALRAVVGFLTFAVAFEFRRTHAPTWWFGVVLGASLFGSFAGAFVGPKLRTVLREEHILAGSVWVVALVALIAGRFGSRPALSVLALTVGLCASTARLAFDAIVQRDAADAVRSRSFARFEATFQLVWVGAALIPVLVHIPTRAACFVLALGMAIAGLSYVTGRRALRRGEVAGPLQRRRARPPSAGTLSPPPPVLPPGEA
jgi:MFS family permease